ncbi:restriction endonuclease subunit S [Candidatus Poriferisodalis sp.]|uniref:restriction endonuclease subunit S n=1 Tax=Candidatus Poriferisodalis sp. TaxID=3101277 RepID=UPI003B5A5E1E
MRLVPLGEVAELRSGVGFPKSFQGRAGGDFPFAKVGDISAVARSGGRCLSKAANYVMSSDLLALKAKPFPPGTIAFAKIGEAIRQNFRVVAQVPILLDNNVMGAIPGNEADPGYLLHFLASLDLYRLAQSTTVPSLRKSELAQIAMPLPSMEEQRRIATVLDAAEAMRAKRRQALTKLDDLIQAVFFDMFGDPTVESGWPRVRLAEVCRYKGQYGANVPAVELASGVPRYLRITDIRSDGTLTDEAVGPGGTEGQWRSKILNPGDIVFARSGATVGKTFLVRDQSPPLVFAGYLIRFVPDQQQILPEFLYQCTRTEKYRSWVVGAATTVAQPNVNASKYAQFELSLPPMEPQHQFVDAVERIRHHRTTLKASSQALDVLFSSLQQRAFRGEL